MTSKAFILVKFVTETGDKITTKYRNHKQNVQKFANLLNFFLKTAQNADKSELYAQGERKGVWRGVDASGVAGE
jgi:hypothetical protein